MNILKKLKAENIWAYRIPVYFFVARLLLVVSIPIEGLKSYGDFWFYFSLADLGVPFLELWVEYPPFFPFLSRIVYLAVGGREHSYIYFLVILFSLVQSINIFLFVKIAHKIYDRVESLTRIIIYSFLLVAVFYGWAYFDSLGVFCMLFGLLLTLNKKDISSGLVLGVGGVVKWFPLLLLPTSWLWLGWRKAIKVIIPALLVLLVSWGYLFMVSPDFTEASIMSQGAKGSWETVWAILDGNMETGNFGLSADRQIAETALQPTGRPSRISPWLTLILFCGVGLALFLGSRVDSEKAAIGFFGVTFVLFLLWSPGYSPQWVLYLLPLVMLAFEKRRSVLLAIVLLFVNLLEWPILLSRGLFQYLDEIILLRTGILILMAVLFGQKVLILKQSEEKVEIETP